MLQFGGHHLAINLTLGASQASMTPSLPAAQPATYTLASTFPDLNAMRAGDGTIVIQSAVTVSLPSGPHRLFFHNRNATPERHAYLANALMPENDRIAVTGQRRNQDQSELTIDLVVRGTAESSRRWVWINLGVGLVLFTPLIRRARLGRE